MLGIVLTAAAAPFLAPVASAGEPAEARLPSARMGFDRAAVEAELSRAVQGDSPEVLEGRLRWLADAYAALSLSTLPEPERKALGDRILGQIAQGEILLRGRIRETDRRLAPMRSGGEPWAAFVRDSSGLLMAAMAAVVVCFALGSLVGYRHGARHASYYGEGDPRLRFLSRPPAAPEQRNGQPMALEQIRRRLRDGQPVLLQLGYEIDPKERVRFLAALGDMQRALGEVEGLRFAAWEDPRHLNRFYECLECRRLQALDRLTDLTGPLPGLAAEIEACRPADGWIVRRAWWGALRDREEAGRQPSASGLGA